MNVSPATPQTDENDITLVIEIGLTDLSCDANLISGTLGLERFVASGAALSNKDDFSSVGAIASTPSRIWMHRAKCSDKDAFISRIRALIRHLHLHRHFLQFLVRDGAFLYFELKISTYKYSPIPLEVEDMALLSDIGLDLTTTLIAYWEPCE